MTDYRVQKGCMGVSMEDGTRYNADSSGRIRVENPMHAHYIEQNAKIAGGHIHQAGVATQIKTKSRYCAPCRFTGFAWQKNCPRCGAEMKED